MFDCFDTDMRYTISSYLIMSCYNKAHSFDSQASQLDFSVMIKRLMCNSDASIIIQKLIEKGFYPKLNELKHADYCYTANAQNIYSHYNRLLYVINESAIPLAKDV